MPYAFEPAELQILGDWIYTAGVLAAGNWWRPTAAASAPSAELDSHEVAEIMFMVIIPPVTALGVAENLDRIQLILDDKDYSDYIQINGTNQNLIMPPQGNYQINGCNYKVVHFGVPLLEAVKFGNTSQLLYKGICPKFAKRATIEAQAGAGGISANFRIQLWGYRYPEDALNRLIGSSIGGELAIADTRTDRTFITNKAVVPVTVDTWTQLPGGVDQAMPKINPYFRFAVNTNATTPNAEYIYRYDLGNVTNRTEDMYWPFDQLNKVLVIQGLGVRAPANLAYTYLNIDGKVRPKRVGWPTTSGLNPLHFGQDPAAALSSRYYPVPQFNRPYVVWQDKGYVAIKDNGVAVGAGDAMVAVNGVLIELAN